MTRYNFDSFECAIQKLAPTCAHCQCRCANCARMAGDRDLVDRH